MLGITDIKGGGDICAVGGIEVLSRNVGRYHTTLRSGVRKGKFRPTTDHEGPNGSISIALLFI